MACGGRLASSGLGAGLLQQAAVLGLGRVFMKNLTLSNAGCLTDLPPGEVDLQASGGIGQAATQFRINVILSAAGLRVLCVMRL